VRAVKSKRTPAPLSEGLAALADKMRDAGLRPTRQRLLIAELLLDGRHRHVTADSLQSEISKAGIIVAEGTVYNTLNQFTDAGLLRRVNLNKDYNVFDTNIHHHHHFYDQAADQLYDIPSDQMKVADLPNPPDGHDITSVDVIIQIAPKA
jgi:Fur family iron response transcriptional regulator